MTTARGGVKVVSIAAPLKSHAPRPINTLNPKLKRRPVPLSPERRLPRPGSHTRSGTATKCYNFDLMLCGWRVKPPTSQSMITLQIGSYLPAMRTHELR